MENSFIPASAQPEIEKFGVTFSPAIFHRIQTETKSLVADIAAQIRPGMTEDAAYQLAKRTLEERGFGKSWHRPYVRFGENTTLIYGKPSRPEVVLQPNDLFFLDVGPVKEGHEADYGETFVVGTDPDHHRIAQDTVDVFHEVSRHWRETQATGVELYAFASRRAQARGWVLNPDWSGHRVSEFPHHVYTKAGLHTVEFTPTRGLWILEIHLNDPAGKYGAFYEDTLE